jgi:anti-sigma B factor antagonist
MITEKLQFVSSDGSRPGVRVLQLKGPLNIHTVFDFQSAARAETSPQLIMDFSEVPFLDSSGLGALVGIHVSAQKAGRKMAFVGMNQQVLTLLEMTRILSMFKIYVTLREAEAAAAA